MVWRRLPATTYPPCRRLRTYVPYRPTHTPRHDRQGGQSGQGCGGRAGEQAQAGVCGEAGAHPSTRGPGRALDCEYVGIITCIKCVLVRMMLSLRLCVLRYA